ncbi:MAG TPA: thioredoxin domain-containing protein [Kofleriaceae bacterium]|nr:thioredoxin domain-containing protein [Kofleriaceae bacterium]
MAAPLLMGGACEKKTGKPSDPGAINALDRAGSGSAAVGPVDKTPLQGIELTVLDKDKQEIFYRLIGSLNSPCGKSENLRKSYTSDTSCKRAPFAVRYLVQLLDDEATEDQARDEYKKKYETKGQQYKFDVSKAPRAGNDDATVRLVEFYDYACPHCKEFKPMLDQVVAEHEGKVVEYFMQFPLGRWPDSKTAAQAALAANAQGKFKEMHALLFAKAPAHSKSEVMGYAKSLGLDMAKFEAAFNAAGAQVEMDHAQGDAAGVESTPALFFNEHKYEGPLNPKYLGMWIDEEVAVNR